MKNGLMPRVLGGSSAGSIVAGIVATRTDEECLRDAFAGRGTAAPGHSGRLQLDFFRPVGYAAKNGAHAGREGRVLPDGANTGGFKRAFQLCLPPALRKWMSSIYDLLPGFKVWYCALTHETARSIVINDQSFLFPSSRSSRQIF